MILTVNMRSSTSGLALCLILAQYNAEYFNLSEIKNVNFRLNRLSLNCSDTKKLFDRTRGYS